MKKIDFNIKVDNTIEKEKTLQNIIDNLLNYEPFKELNATKEEIRGNLMLMQEVMITDIECSMLGIDQCSSENKIHLIVSRVNDKLFFRYECCNKFLQEFKDKQHKNKFIYNYYKGTAISNVFLTKENFVKANISVAPIIKEYVLNKSQDKIKGMYINGTFGVGKTYLMFAFANDLIEEKDMKVCFVFLPEYINIIKKGFGENESYKEYASQLTEDFKNVDVLFIDDIGTEVSSEWFYIEYLFNILNYRMSQDKITFFSSNLTLDQLQSTFNSKFKEADSRTSVLRLMDRIRTLVGNKEYTLKGENLRYDK